MCERAMDREVPMGDLIVTGSEDNLTCHAVGSCVVITLYDPSHKIGALLHAMLPSSKAHTLSYREALSDEKTDARYVDTAIDEALKEMKAQGAQRKNIEAKLVGGANMFGFSSPDIGMENISSAKKKLEKEGIRLTGESVGGSQGRSVEFSPASGIVTVKMEF